LGLRHLADHPYGDLEVPKLGPALLALPKMTLDRLGL
jgi:hypothetical protein